MAWFDRHAASASPAVAPLSRERLAAVLRQQDWSYTYDDDDDIRARFNGDLFYFMLSGSRLEILNVLGYMPEDIPMSLLEEARTAIEDWRREHLWPGLFWRANDDAGLTFSVGGAVAVDWEEGVTDAQLLDHIHCGVGTCNEAFAELRDRLGLERIASEIADAKASQYDLRAMDPQESLELVTRLTDEDEEEVVIRLLDAVPAAELDDELRGCLAVAYSNTGRFEQALEHLDLMGPAHQDDARWHFRRGCVLHRLSTRQDGAQQDDLRAQAREEYRRCLALAPTPDVAQDCAQFLGMLGDDATTALFKRSTALELRRALGDYRFGAGVLAGEVVLCSRTVPVEVPYTVGPGAEAALVRSLATVHHLVDHDRQWHRRLVEDPELDAAIRSGLPEADAEAVRERLPESIIKLTVEGEALTVRLFDAPSRFKAELHGDVTTGFHEVTRH